jgi:hypothetical protein
LRSLPKNGEERYGQDQEYLGSTEAITKRVINGV